jgi:hypothetical protein
MGDSPSPTESNGRGPSGKFGVGNSCAKGNPFAKRVARLRSALFKAITPADLRDVLATLLKQANEMRVRHLQVSFSERQALAPLLVDEPEARRLLGGLCAKSMYNLRRQGLPFVKIGSRVMYVPAELAQWVKTQKGGSNGS